MSQEPFADPPPDSPDAEVERGSDADEAAARLLRGAWKSSPGLVMSLLFHAGILALLPLIVFQEKIREALGIPVSIGLNATRVDPERPYKPISAGPPSSTGEGMDEPPVFFPDAVAAERNESKAGKGEEDASTISGESRSILTHFASDPSAGGFSGRLAKGPPGTNFSLGVGGGSGTGGARYGTGLRGAAGRRNLVARGGGSKYTEAAVELGLSWLARHQSRDGSWKQRSPCTECTPTGGEAQVAATALAVLAFITAGYGPESTVTITDRATGRTLSYGDTVRAGLNFLRSRQQRDECITTGESSYSGLYEHSFATMAFCEAYHTTQNADLRERAERGLKFILAHQTQGGWYDSSVSGACVQALRAARNSGVAIPDKAVDGVRKWFVRCGTSSGETGYGGSDEGGAALTAIGLYARRFVDPGRTVADKFMSLAARKVEGYIGNALYGGGDLYTWYYAMLGLFEFEGPTGKSFQAVNKAVTTALVTAQHRESDCSAGAWDAPGRISAYGRPLGTAMAVLTLETYYRYVDVEKPLDGAKTGERPDAKPEKTAPGAAEPSGEGPR